MSLLILHRSIGSSQRNAPKTVKMEDVDEALAVLHALEEAGYCLIVEIDKK